MLGALLGIFTSSGMGAIVGLVGSFLTKMEDRKMQAQKADFDLKMADIRAKEFLAEASHELDMADKQVARAQVEGDIEADIAEMAVRKESLKEQTMLYGIKWVDAIRGIMRPFITLYILILATIVTIKIGSYVGGLEALDDAMMQALYGDTILQIFFLLNVVITWWFGARPPSKRKG